MNPLYCDCIGVFKLPPKLWLLMFEGTEVSGEVMGDDRLLALLPEVTILLTLSARLALRGCARGRVDPEE